MVKLAFIFPGQGSQAPGMGTEVAARWPAAAARWTEAADILGYDLLKVCGEGPEERLADTGIAQPALYVAGCAVHAVLAAEGVVPAFVAGHSLGEYTACAAAGVFSFADGLRAVRERAEAMRAAGAARPGGMLAAIGARAEDVDAWVAGAAARGVVVVANRNAPDQLIVSGEPAALDAVEAAGQAAGARIIRLKVSGAFHSPLMREAQDRMTAVLAGLTLREPACPLIGNVAGLPLGTARLVREELDAQLLSAVRWDACVRALAGGGVGLAVECGPGRVLAGLIRKIDRSVKTASTGSAGELEAALGAVREVAHAGSA